MISLDGSNMWRGLKIVQRLYDAVDDAESLLVIHVPLGLSAAPLMTNVVYNIQWTLVDGSLRSL